MGSFLIHGISNEVGKALVTHTYTKAVALPVRYAGGKQLLTGRITGMNLY
ncbi:MAG: hypothetical protein IPH18_18115 [Chitinophagaceae bacterium]|nr:hypothetical protein [Chitinophagaceae bacterium]